MTTTGMQIVDLITDNGKPAPDMTHALKLLGNGSMQAGLTRIGNHFKAEISAAFSKGLTKGRIQGSILGILGTIAVGKTIALTVNKQKKSAAHETEGKDILRGSVKNFVALVKNGSFLVRITDMTILIEKEFIYGSSKRPNPTDYYRKQHYQCG